MPLEGREQGLAGPATATVTISEGRLYGLPSPYPLDGRPVSTHPRSARGFASMNCFLLIEGDEALLIDTGLPASEDDLLSQLAELLEPSTKLNLLILRLSEFNSVSNSRSVADRFGIDEIVMGVVRPDDFHAWLEFRADQTQWREPAGANGGLATAGRRDITGSETIAGPGGRTLEVIRPDLQFLPTYWLYDADTRTLISSDAFTHVWRQSPDGPWTVDDVDDGPSVSELSDYLLGSRYWWLAGANTEPLRRSLAELHDTHQIDCVAPAFGCILRGQSVVSHHFALMDAALAELHQRPPIGPDLAPDTNGDAR